MKEKIKNSNILTIIILLILSFIIISTAQSRGGGDDAVYKAAFHNFSEFITWSKEFTSVWSGRVIASGISVIFLNVNIHVYRIVTTLVITILVYSIYKIIEILHEEKNKYSKIILIGIFSMLLLIHKTEFSESVVWITGAFNYLYPITALCVGIIPFIKMIKNKKISVIEYILYLPAIIYACNVEQSGAIFVCFSIICIIMTIIEKKKVNTFNWISVIIGILVLIFSLTVKGNEVRFFAETIHWYRDYEMLSFQDKVFQGIYITLNQLYNSNVIIMIILSGLVIYLNKNKDNKSIIVASIPLIYSVLKITPFNLIFEGTSIENTGKYLKDVIYNFPQYGIETMFEVKYIISLVLGLSITLILAIMIFTSFKDRKKSIIYTIIYLAGLCSSLIMGLSPTVFASGVRIFFMTDIMIIVVIAGLANEILSKKDIKIKQLISIIIPIGIGLLQILRFIKQ